MTTATSEQAEVLLFYLYTAIDESAAEDLVAEQQKICAALGLCGRVRLASEGINGSLGGQHDATAAYTVFMDAHPTFQGIQWKRSRAPPEPFWQLEVKWVPQIVGCGPVMGAAPLSMGGEHLSPKEFHRAVLKADAGKAVLIDMRNHYETAIGSFRSAVCPKMRNFAQLPAWVAANKAALKDKEVYMFCTGGIRCEKASAYLRTTGLPKSVGQLAGGIHTYLAEFSPSAARLGLGADPVQRRVQAEATGAGGGAAEANMGNDEAAATGASSPQAPCLFQGINFAFDRRASSELAGTGGEARISCCAYCNAPSDNFKGGCKTRDGGCDVCKDPLIVCDACRAREASRGAKLLCPEHQLMSTEWREYLTAARYTRHELRTVLRELRAVLAASLAMTPKQQRNQKKRQRNLRTQIERLRAFLGDEDDGETETSAAAHTASNAEGEGDDGSSSSAAAVAAAGEETKGDGTARVKEEEGVAPAFVGLVPMLNARMRRMELLDEATMSVRAL